MFPISVRNSTSRIVELTTKGSKKLYRFKQLNYSLGNCTFRIYFESFQEVTINNFFDETNPEFPFWHQDGVKKKTKEKGSLKK